MDDAVFEPYLRLPEEMRVNLVISQQPQRVYRYLRERHLSRIHFYPLVEQAANGQLSAESVTGEAWGNFLSAIFDTWVREDIGRVSIPLFEDTLNVWREFQHDDAAQETLSATCLNCTQLRFCLGCRIASDSVLCSGYRQFFAYSAPYMRVMRDLLKQHRSPMELMALLR